MGTRKNLKGMGERKEREALEGFKVWNGRGFGFGFFSLGIFSTWVWGIGLEGLPWGRPEKELLS